MVDYSKWDNLDSGDSDSDSGGGPAVAAQTKRQQQQKQQQQQPPKQDSRSTALSSRKAADDERGLDQAEVLRLQGNAAFERGDVLKAMGAYDAQLRVLEGRKDEAAVEMACGALLNQASGFIRLKNFSEAEARCSRLLDSTTPSGGVRVAGGATARARALHFRGFARLQQGRFEGACSDLRSSMAAGTSSGDEARALLLEAEAGAAMASCPDPEAKGRELLRKGQGREAAEHFRDAAARARRRAIAGVDSRRGPPSKSGDKSSKGSGGGSPPYAPATVELARNLRLQGTAVAMAGDRSSAEMLLRASLKELRGERGVRGAERGGGAEDTLEEEQGLALAALGSLLAQAGKHAQAVEPLREAVAVLDQTLTETPVEKRGAADSGGTTTCATTPDAASSTSSSPAAEAKKAALTRTLTGTLTFLGTSLLALGAQSTGGDGKASVNGGERDRGGAGSTPGATSEGMADSTGPVTGVAREGKEPNAEAKPVDGSTKEDAEAVEVLRRAHEVLKAETAAMAETAASGRRTGLDVVNLAGGGTRGEKEVRKQTAKVLDTLSEAYARGRRWEQARSAAEQSLTAWRSLGSDGRAGAAASLLSLGHLILQLHGVGAGIEEASARWEEAAMCFDDGGERPSVAAEVRLRIAGYYSKVARSDPSRLESLGAKIATHYSGAAGLFAREREEKTKSLKRSAAAVAAAKSPRSSVGKDSRSPETGPPLPPSLVDALEPDGWSRWELAEQEASAWEGFAGAVGDDHDAAVTALRKAEGLLDEANVSEKDERWSLRKVGILHNQALALAQGGDHVMAEDKLLKAVEVLQELDGVDADAEACAHKDTLMDLFKYLAILRRARGDEHGVEEALTKVAKLGGRHGVEDLEELRRLVAGSAI
ncbi:unnamed protein product [Scytosiphon promiscuus]